MKTRVNPSIDIVHLATMFEELLKEELKDDELRECSDSFYHNPKSLEHIYSMPNGHLVRICVEEFV